MEGAGGESSGKVGNKAADVKKGNSRGERKPEGKVDKGKGREREGAAGVEGGESEEVDGGEDSEGGAVQKLSAAHDYRRQVTEALLYQLRLWRPEAVRKRKGGTMPYKHLPKFALDNQVRLFGWPVDRVPQFPGDLSFDVDKMLKREWEHLWRAACVDKSMGIEPWFAGMSSALISSMPGAD